MHGSDWVAAMHKGAGGNTYTKGMRLAGWLFEVAEGWDEDYLVGWIFTDRHSWGE